MYSLLKVKEITDITNQSGGKIELHFEIGRGPIALKTVIINNNGSAEFKCLGNNRKSMLLLLDGIILDSIYKEVKEGRYSKYIDRAKTIDFILNKAKDEQGHIELVNIIQDCKVTDIYPNGDVLYTEKGRKEYFKLGNFKNEFLEAIEIEIKNNKYL